MDTEALAVGLIGIGAGSLLALFGVRFFWVLLALWGAIVGFLAGADLAAALLGEGFLATIAGWIAGIAGAVVAGPAGRRRLLGGGSSSCAGGVGYADRERGPPDAGRRTAACSTAAAGLGTAAVLVVLALVLRRCRSCSSPS